MTEGVGCATVRIAEPGALAPPRDQKALLGLDAGKGSPPSTKGVRSITPESF